MRRTIPGATLDPKAPAGHPLHPSTPREHAEPQQEEEQAIGGDQARQAALRAHLEGRYLTPAERETDAGPIVLDVLADRERTVLDAYDQDPMPAVEITDTTGVRWGWAVYDDERPDGWVPLDTAPPAPEQPRRATRPSKPRTGTKPAPRSQRTAALADALDKLEKAKKAP